MTRATVGRAVVEEAVVGEAVRRLRGTYLFGGLAASDLEDLARACELLVLAPGDELSTGAITAGGATGGPNAFLLVESGRLRVTTTDGQVSEVHAGEHLGDGAVLGWTDGFSAHALSAARVFALSHDRYRTFVETHPDIAAAVEDIEERIRHTARARLRPSHDELETLLSGFLATQDHEVLRMVEDEVQWVPIASGTVLMEEGQPSDCLWIVASGRVAITCRREDGTEVRIDESGPGEALGEMGLLTNEPRSASATAVDDCELVRLSRDAFDDLVASHAVVARAFMSLLAARLSQGMRKRALMTQVRFLPLVTRAECDEVVRTENLVLRNLRITQMYHRLSLELTLLLGQHDANWCTYGCNASKTAGYSIRREEVPFYEAMNALRQDVRVARAVGGVRSRLASTRLGQLVDDALAEVSRMISAGNLKVFAELGPVFADFTRTFHEDHARDSAKLERFLGTLTPGPTDGGGQQTLAEALRHYYDAMFEADHRRKAQLILLGNMKVGLHEQIRLQPHIAGAMDAPMRVGLSAIAAAASTGPRWLPPKAARRVHHVVEHEEEVLLGWVTRRWRQRVTRNLMTLRLPYGAVRLGADVPHLPDKSMYPDVLQDVVVPELQEFIDRFDRDPDGVGASRASDWASLEDRMTFIIELMRSRQRSLELFDQPFLLEQRQAITAGLVPVGTL